jgi:hypothetical protein
VPFDLESDWPLLAAAKEAEDLFEQLLLRDSEIPLLSSHANSIHA